MASLEIRKNRELTHLLLVEDDDGDAKGIERAFKKAKIQNPIHRAHDGIEALEMLRGDIGNDKVPSPRILIVDINMPRMNGLDLIKKIREDKDLKSSIVFVLTTSSDDDDIFRSYGLNVAGYIVKEEAGKDFLKLTELLGAYWQIVEIPD